MADADTPARAAHLRSLLEREPDGYEKAELLDLSGLEPGEFRDAIALLESDLAPDEERYVLIRRVGGPSEDPGEDGPDTAGEGLTGDGDQDAPRPRLDAGPPASGPSYRASFGVVMQFGATRGENRDAAAVKRAEAFGAALQEFTGGTVTLEALDAFDAPRSVLPAPDGDGGD